MRKTPAGVRNSALSWQTELPAYLAVFGDTAGLSANLFWTHTFEHEIAAVSGGTTIDCAGRFGWPCTGAATGQTFPQDRVTTRFDYTSGKLTAHLTWLWISGADNAAELGAILSGIADPDIGVPEISSRNYVDLAFSYRFTDNFIARATIANVTDASPPFMADAVNSNNTDTTLYDVFGRSYSLRLSLHF